MCPCGIVYSIKCNIRAESPWDFTDLLLSWKHMPNIVIYDFACGLATHMNLRDPERLSFKPFEGRLRDPAEENIALVKAGHLKVSLPWLNFRKLVPDNNNGFSWALCSIWSISWGQHKGWLSSPEEAWPSAATCWKSKQSSSRTAVCKHEKKKTF